jgi:hypothetical protein
MDFKLTPQLGSRKRGIITDIRLKISSVLNETKHFIGRSPLQSYFSAQLRRGSENLRTHMLLEG